MKITTFLSVNNENLGAIARMSNGTWICIVYKGVQVAPKQGFQKYVWVTIVLRSTLDILKTNADFSMKFSALFGMWSSQDQCNI